MNLKSSHKALGIAAILLCAALNYQNCGTAEQIDSADTVQSETLSSALTSAKVQSCDPAKSSDCYMISVDVKGAAGELLLQNNGYDDLRLNRDGTYTFSQSLSAGSKYQIEVFKDPTDQVCEITNGAGIVKDSKSMVSVSCVNVPVDCKKGEKAWGFPTGTSQALGTVALMINGTNGTNSSYSGGAQPVLGMSDNQTAVVYYRSTNQYHNRHAINMSTNAVSTVSEIDNEFWHSVDQNSNGDIVASWVSAGNVKIASRIGNVWQPVQSVAIPGVVAIEPNVAISNSADMIVTWRSNYNDYCFVAHRVSGVWNMPTSISNRINIAVSGQCIQPKVAMAKASNKAMIVWEKLGPPTRVYASEFDGFTWDHPTSNADYFNTAFTAEMKSPEVSISDNGQKMAVVWSSGTNNHYVAVRDSGIWNFPGTLVGAFAHNSDKDPALKINNLGTIIVAWPMNTGNLFMNEKINGVWQPGIQINPPGTIVYDQNQKSYDIDLNNVGKAIITWPAFYAGNNKFYKSEKLNHADPWTHPNNPANYFGDVVAATGYGFSRVEVDEKCNAILAWNDGGYVFRAEYE